MDARQTNLNLSTQLVEVIDELAFENDRSRSWIVEMLLRKSRQVDEYCKKRKIKLRPRR